MAGMGAARAEDAQGTPTQSHIPPSTLVYVDECVLIPSWAGAGGAARLPEIVFY